MSLFFLVSHSSSLLSLALTRVSVEARDDRNGLALVPRHAHDGHLPSASCSLLLLDALGPALLLLLAL